MTMPPPPGDDPEREEPAAFRPPFEAVPEVERLRQMAQVVYILLLAGLVVGVTYLVAVVMAYVYRDDAPPWLRSHFTYQIRTFWIGLGLTVLGGLLTLVLVGWVVLLAAVVWLIVRCAKGLKAIGEHRAIG